MTNGLIKVLIVEDSLVNQNLLKGLILSDSRFKLVGIANNGRQAIEYVSLYSPDVVSMDIHMPVMDGVEATMNIMQKTPVPIIIVSSFYQSSEVELAIKVLDAGAVTILPKPFGPGHPKFAQSSRQYLNMLKAMSEVKVVRRKNTDGSKASPSPFSGFSTPKPTLNAREFKILVIGASAGGPEGIRTILTGLPPDFPLPVFIVQHIDANFAEGFCSWLNTFSKLPVHIAVNGEPFLPGNVYLPPGDRHLVVRSDSIIGVINDGPIKGLRPAVALLFQSVAAVYGKNTIAVLLSGMGKDGAVELKTLYEIGAHTLVQSEQSCLVFGMPGEAVKIGAASKIMSPAEMIKEITDLTK
ncbi:MAG: chemotaxis-specific protein-glutamate methyltransferase CheB [Bacteroidales bacterium]